MMMSFQSFVVVVAPWRDSDLVDMKNIGFNW